MLVKLPDVPSCRCIRLDPEMIGSIDIQVENAHKQTERWLVLVGYRLNPQVFMFEFTHREAAEAWADEVAELVNRASRVGHKPEWPSPAGHLPNGEQIDAACREAVPNFDNLDFNAQTDWRERSVDWFKAWSKVLG